MDSNKWQRLIEEYNQKHALLERSDELSLKEASAAKALLTDPRNKRSEAEKQRTALKIKLVFTARKQALVFLSHPRLYEFARGACEKQSFKESCWTLSDAEVEIVFFALLEIYAKLLGL